LSASVVAALWSANAIGIGREAKCKSCAVSSHRAVGRGFEEQREEDENKEEFP